MDGSISDRTQPAPLGESGAVGLLEGVSGIEVAVLVEVVVDRRVNGGELLKTSHLPEAEHRPLPSSQRQM